jgi:hypothetical protein
LLVEREYPDYNNIKLELGINLNISSQPLDGFIDSPWPMYCHDARHTGRSPYSTANNSGDEIWRFATEGGGGLGLTCC